MQSCYAQCLPGGNERLACHTAPHVPLLCQAACTAVAAGCHRLTQPELPAGDTLFSLGCGRLFEGTPAQMWTSLSKVSSSFAGTLGYRLQLCRKPLQMHMPSTLMPAQLTRQCCIACTASWMTSQQFHFSVAVCGAARGHSCVLRTRVHAEQRALCHARGWRQCR